MADRYLNQGVNRLQQLDTVDANDALQGPGLYGSPRVDLYLLPPYSSFRPIPID